ncbi:MAG TPA: alpha/beta fold hydrolase [Solirubrobacteraceae bacterium]|nr:alpha/beta fold hydrolase [Solirubrobacteraceae bacterium]
MAAPLPLKDRLEIVEQAFRSLPERYLGAEPGFDATYHIKLCDIGRTWEVRCTPHAARVRKGASRSAADVTLTTDAETWLALREGEFSGIEAFQRRRLGVRGNLDHAVAFEGMFRLPQGRPPLLRIRDIPVGRQRVSTLTMGAGPDVLLIHGLGGTRASFFETAAALSSRYRVHAPDLPGFGSSSKPPLGAYNAHWFAEVMLGLMDELGIERAHIVGNSMGGRTAIEMGLLAPHRVGALGLLCPAVAWIRRGLHPIVRLLRPEFGLLPHGFRRSTVASQFWSIFYDRDVLDPAVGDLMVDEFRRIYQSAGARYAFLASARNIYLEAPYGARGFYPRLAGLTPPALFVWGSHDNLVPPAFSRHVRKWLPGAEQVTLENCGHVPQVECTERTNQLLMDFFARAERSGEVDLRTRSGRPGPLSAVDSGTEAA